MISLCLHSSGEIEELNIEQKIIHTYFDGDEITFCGAIFDLNVVAMARQTKQENDIINVFSQKFPSMFEETFGKILLIGTDVNGEECNFDIEAVKQILLFE